jgi:hypothetical protein
MPFLETFPAGNTLKFIQGKKICHLFLVIITLCQEAGSDRWWHHCEDSMHISQHGNRRVLSFEVLGHI